MDFIRYEAAGPVATLAMSRPKANALHMAMVAEMHEALDLAVADASVRAVILSSGLEKFFSAGLDAVEVFSYDRERMGEFLGLYGGLASKLRSVPKPVIAAIPGHCYAGGTILALCCDFRLMAEGEFGIALNEIDIGVVLPRGVVDLAAEVVGEGQARRMVLTGQPVPPQRALAIGLVDEVCAPGSLAGRAAEWAAMLAQKAPAAYAGIKRVARGGGLGLTPEVEPWFTPEAEQRKKALFASLKR